MQRHYLRCGFTLPEVIVVIAIMCIALSIMIPAVQAMREVSRRVKCGNNLNQLALAMQSYSDSWNTFPIGVQIPAWGKRSIGNWGWAPAVMPHLELATVAERAGYGKVPMTVALNDRSGAPLTAMQQRLELFRCPSGVDPSTPLNTLFVIESKHCAMSNYVVSNGSYSFRSRLGQLLQDSSVNTGFQNGMFAESGTNPHHRGPGLRRPSNVTDGTSCTILLGERCWRRYSIDYGAAVVWGASGHVAASGSDADGYVCLFGSGWVHINSPARPYHASLANHRRGFSSNHGRGAQVLYVDGSVHFLDDQIDHEDVTSATQITSTFSKLLAIDDGGVLNPYR